MHEKCCAPPKRGFGCMPCFTAPIMPLFNMCPIPPFPQPCPLPICMPAGCAPCPFPPFPPLPGPCEPRMMIPSYRVPGPFCCDGFADGCAGEMCNRECCHEGHYMKPHLVVIHKPHRHHPMQKPQHKHWMRETEVELGGGMEIEKPNPLGNWMGHLADWFGKEGAAEPGMDGGGGKWGNWLGMDGSGGMESKMPRGYHPGGMMGAKPWMPKGGSMGEGMDEGMENRMNERMDDRDGDSSGRKFWPK